MTARRVVVFALPAALVVLAIACDDESSEQPGSPESGIDGGGVQSDASGLGDAGLDAETSTGSPPPSRPSALACSRSSPRPAGNATSDGGVDASIECTLDTDCTTKADGRCSELRSTAWSGNQSLGTRCTYDACTTDSECGSGVCGCALGFAGQNVCLPQGNCRIDAECSQGQFCSFSNPFILPAPGVIETGNEQGGGGGHPREALGWFCTTTTDLCRPGERQDGSASEGCVYAPDQNRWIWWYQP